MQVEEAVQVEQVVQVPETMQIQEEWSFRKEAKHKSKETSAQKEHVSEINDISEVMLKESRGIIESLSKEEATLNLLRHKNAHASEIKRQAEGVRKHFEDHLECNVKPDLFREQQTIARVQMQVENTGSFVTKLSSVLEDAQKQQQTLEGVKGAARKRCEAMKEEVEAMVKMKKELSVEFDTKMKELQNEENAMVEFHSVKIKKLDDEFLALKATANNDWNVDVKAEIAKCKATIQQQNEEKEELAAEKQRHVLKLNAIDAELALVTSQRNNLNEDVELQQARVKLDGLNNRLETLQIMIKALNQSIAEKESVNYNTSALHDKHSKLKEANEALLADGTDTDKKTNEIKKMLGTLQKLKQENHLKSMQKLKKERETNRAKLNLKRLQNQWDAAVKSKEEQKSALENLRRKITECKTRQQQIIQLQNDIEQYKADYDKKTEYKLQILKQQSDYRIKLEQLRMKQEDNDKKRNEIEEIKQSLKQTEEQLEIKIRLKEKLEKEKAECQRAIDTNSDHISRPNTSSNLRGTPKSVSQPSASEKDTYEGLFSGSPSARSMRSKDSALLMKLFSQSHTTDECKKRK